MQTKKVLKCFKHILIVNQNGCIYKSSHLIDIFVMCKNIISGRSNNFGSCSGSEQDKRG